MKQIVDSSEPEQCMVVLFSHGISIAMAFFNAKTPNKQIAIFFFDHSCEHSRISKLRSFAATKKVILTSFWFLLDSALELFTLENLIKN